MASPQRGESAQGRSSLARWLCPLALFCSFLNAQSAQNFVSTDCSDPLLAESMACSSQSQSSEPLQPFAGQSGSSNAPSANPPLSSTIYSDFEQYSRPAEQQTNTQLAPQPLTEFQKFVASSTGTILPIFGADLFDHVPSTFAPVDMAPVLPDYVVGPGDELRIRIWGQVNIQANLRVDRSGEIYLPQVGNVHVAGLAFSELDMHLRDAVGRVYRNFNLTVDMGQIRSIQVYVTGEARRPGLYTVSSLSTLVDALFASGGPAVEGSMRSIELRRGGAVVTRFDLYDLLIKGLKTKDAKLLPGDVIYIPPAGQQVAVLGSVRNPAIYELLPQESLSSALADAGGVSAVAAEARVSIERIDEHRDRRAIEVAYDASGLNTVLTEGDVIRVYSILPKYEKTVTLRGNIANPGRFAWHEGMRLSELIPDKDSLLTRNYWWRRAQMGLPAPEFEPIPGFANMRQPADNHPITLPQGAQVQTITCSNQSVPGPCQIGVAQDQYGGQNTEAIQDQSTLQEGTAVAPLGQLGMGQNQSLTAQMRAGSTSLAGTQTPAVSQFQIPAQRTDVRLPAPDIDWDYAVIERINQETLKTDLIPFGLGELVLQHDAAQDLVLQPGDVVTIFSAADIEVPIAEQTKLIRLEGEFIHAGIYSVRPGETLRQLVERAGGLTSNAYLYGSEFTRVSARTVQQARIDEYVQSLSLDIQRSLVRLSTSAAAASQQALGGAAQGTEQGLLASLKQIRATGRIVLPFQPGSTGIDSIPNITLEDGDRFVVPHVSGFVNVIGAVYDQNSFLFKHDARAGEYLRQAGGLNRNADRHHQFIIRADGDVVSYDSAKGLWGNEFNDLRVYPGDTIVVPERIPKASALYGVMNWSQMFSQFALGAAALNVIQ